jgi:UDPglucose--hexose-1-phosphate uridylyltransferase
MAKNEIRQNKATQEWVIYAPSRGKRPKDFREDSDKENLPGYDENCPFCPGHEKKLSTVLMEIPNPKTQRWSTRVVPNKFPALVHNVSTERIKKGINVTMPGYGRHEVIIENPKHNRDIAKMDLVEVEILIETYQRRYADVMKEFRNLTPMIFRNHGKNAGTSLLHPHSQLIVTGFVPKHIRDKKIEAQKYYDEWGRCVFCDMLKFEFDDNKRLLSESKSMVAFVPFAAEVPFQVNIMPKEHQADFGKISDKEKSELAKMLKEILTKLHKKLDDPDYNYIINTAGRYEADEPHLHWNLEIRPRLTKNAGFEIGSGISINPSFPEDDAEFLAK